MSSDGSENARFKAFSVYLHIWDMYISYKLPPAGDVQ